MTDAALSSMHARSTFAKLLDVWNGGSIEGMTRLLAPGYRGHMLHMVGGERDASAYPGWILRYREANPGATFVIVEQFVADDRLVSRLTATRADPVSRRPLVANGLNLSRYESNGRLAEEWAIWSPWLDVAGDS